MDDALFDLSESADSSSRAQQAHATLTDREVG
jgi:hypothetical protein